jgi:protein-S-isoprenylcysteine O-methyltransferase Ste14
MLLIPSLEIGIWNAWIFTIWLVISPFLPKIIIKEKIISKKLSTSAPMKYETILNIISMGAIILGFIYSIFLPIRLDTILFYVGLIIFLFGLIIEILVLFTLRNINLDKPFTIGPYKYSRHPLYLSLLLIIISVVIMTLSWIILLILIILIIHLVIAVPAEEKYCLEKYGNEYKEYLKKTPRWIGIPKS